jgi:hypothetical protein
MNNSYDCKERNQRGIKEWKGAKEWKWSVGEPYQRSARFRKSQQDIEEEQMAFNREMEQNEQKMKQSAYEQSFLTEHDSWGIGIGSDMDSFSFQSANKREEASNKMAERQMVGQIGFNPFLSNNSYVDDVAVQENFLRPKPTSFDREKHNELG